MACRGGCHERGARGRVVREVRRARAINQDSYDNEIQCFGPECVSRVLSKKHLFIFLTKQFENSSLINGEILVLESLWPAPPVPRSETGTPRLMVFLSPLEFSKNSTDIHKFYKRPQVKISRTRVSWIIMLDNRRSWKL